MGKFSAALLTGGSDIKAQNAHNYLVELLETGYVSNLMLDGHRIRVDVNPKDGFTISSDEEVIGGLTSINGTISLVAGILTNDATDTECWASIGEQVVGASTLYGIAVYKKGFSTSVPALRIATNDAGTFYLVDSNEAVRISMTPTETIIGDVGGVTRFSANTNYTVLVDADTYARFLASATTTNIIAGQNSETYLEVAPTYIKAYCGGGMAGINDLGLLNAIDANGIKNGFGIVATDSYATYHYPAGYGIFHSENPSGYNYIAQTFLDSSNRLWHRIYLASWTAWA